MSVHGVLRSDFADAADERRFRLQPKRNGVHESEHAAAHDGGAKEVGVLGAVAESANGVRAGDSERGDERIHAMGERQDFGSQAALHNESAGSRGADFRRCEGALAS